MASSAKSFLELNESELLYNIAMIEENIDSNRISPEQRKLVSRGLERYQKRLLELRSAMTPEKKNVVERNANVEPEILQSEIETSNETTAETPNIKRIIPFAVGNDTDSNMELTELELKKEFDILSKHISLMFSDPIYFQRWQLHKNKICTDIQNWADLKERNKESKREIYKQSIIEACDTLNNIAHKATKIEYRDHLLGIVYFATCASGKTIGFRAGCIKDILVDTGILKSLSYQD